MVLTSSDIRFTVSYDDSPNIKITDNIQSAYNTLYGLTLADVNIRLKIEFGSDIIFDGISNLTEDITLSSSWYKNIGISEGLKLNILGVPVHGLYKFTYSIYNTATSVDAPPLASVVQYHNYGYVRPTANLTIDYSCGSSTQTPYIRSKDSTIYMIEYNGQSVYGSPTYTSHKFNYPISSGQNNINQSPATSEILHGNLFTLLNTSSIASNCTFTIQTADSTNNMTVTYKCYINAETSENVSCDECTCLYWHCFNNIYDKYYEMLGVNPTLAIKYKSMLTDVSINYAYYHQALNCGEDATKFCNKLKELATLENCTCLPAQTTSVRISPVGGNSSLSYVNGAEIDGNGHLIVKYNDGNTEDVGVVVGADGNAGAAGANGTAGSAGVAGAAGANGTSVIGVLYDDLKSLPSSAYTSMKSFTFTENKLANLGDKLKIRYYLAPLSVNYSFLSTVLLNTTATTETNYITTDDTIEFEFVNIQKGATTSNIVIYVNGKFTGELTITNSTNTSIDIQAKQSTGVPVDLVIHAVFVEQSKGNI